MFILCLLDAPFYIALQATRSADIICATIRRDHASTRQIPKETAARMAHIVPLHMDHMTCGVPCTISGAIKSKTISNIWTSLPVRHVTWILSCKFTAPSAWDWQRSAGDGNSGWHKFNRSRWRRRTVGAGSEHGPHREDLERGTSLARYNRILIHQSWWH